MPADLAADLKKVAVENDRTLSAELRQAARSYLETREDSAG